MGRPGPNAGQFNHAEGIAFDSAGPCACLYVADSNNNRIQKFDINGNFIDMWGVFGAPNGELYGPFDVAVDSSGNVYVTDVNNNRVQVFNNAGGYSDNGVLPEVERVNSLAQLVLRWTLLTTYM